MRIPQALLLGTVVALHSLLLTGCGGGSPKPIGPPPKPKGKIVVVGSGGCDGQDTHCQDDKPAEKVMTFLTVDEDGVLRNWTKLSNLPGLPAWFAVYSPAHSNFSCLYVTYPDSSSIDVFQWSEGLPRGPIQTLSGEAIHENANPVYGDIVDPDGHGPTLVVANYHGPDNQNSSIGASVQTFSISHVPGKSSMCTLAPVDVKPHAGSSVNKDRQASAHPHSAVAYKGSNIHFRRFVFVCDLGMDIIFTYNTSSEGKLTELARTPTKPGIGPRHSVVHPTKDYLFVVSEMGSTVDSYHIETDGKLTLVANVTTLPDVDPQNYGSKAAELAITPDGLHLYASNRAFSPKFKDTIAVFNITSDGKLILTQQVDSPPFPRGMVLMPPGSDGKQTLLVASQTNSEVVSYHVDAKNGHLTRTGSSQKGPWGAAAFAFGAGGEHSHSLEVDSADVVV